MDKGNGSIKKFRNSYHDVLWRFEIVKDNYKNVKSLKLTDYKKLKEELEYFLKWQAKNANEYAEYLDEREINYFNDIAKYFFLRINYIEKKYGINKKYKWEELK